MTTSMTKTIYLAGGCFYSAEQYHQDYLQKNPQGYCHLRPELFEYARKQNR